MFRLRKYWPLIVLLSLLDLSLCARCNSHRRPSTDCSTSTRCHNRAAAHCASRAADRSSA